MMDVVHHHDRIRLYREEDYNINFVTTLLYSMDLAPPLILMYYITKTLIYCTVTLGRVIQKTV